MNAQRNEVFSAIYEIERDNILTECNQAVVGASEYLLEEFRDVISEQSVTFIGDAVEESRPAIEAVLGSSVRLLDGMPALAPVVADLGSRRQHLAVASHGLRPVYVRKPDAVMARERKREGLKRS